MLIKRAIQTLILCALLLFAVSAYSDQQAYISEEDSYKTVEVLSQHFEYVDYCALCDGSKPLVIQIQSVEMKFTNYENYWEVFINNQPIDLAYSYILNEGEWVNLAYYMQLEVDSVPMNLTQNELLNLQH